MIPFVKTFPVIKGGVGKDRVDDARGEDGVEMTDVSDALANSNRFLLLRRQVMAAAPSSSLRPVLRLCWECLGFIVGYCCIGVSPFMFTDHGKCIVIIVLSKSEDDVAGRGDPSGYPTHCPTK